MTSLSSFLNFWFCNFLVPFFSLAWWRFNFFMLWNVKRDSCLLQWAAERRWNRLLSVKFLRALVFMYWIRSSIVHQLLDIDETIEASHSILLRRTKMDMKQKNVRGDKRIFVFDLKILLVFHQVILNFPEHLKKNYILVDWGRDQKIAYWLESFAYWRIRFASWRSKFASWLSYLLPKFFLKSHNRLPTCNQILENKNSNLITLVSVNVFFYFNERYDNQPAVFS